MKLYFHAVCTFSSLFFFILCYSYCLHFVDSHFSFFFYTTYYHYCVPFISRSKLPLYLSVKHLCLVSGNAQFYFFFSATHKCHYKHLNFKHNVRTQELVFFNGLATWQHFYYYFSFLVDLYVCTCTCHRVKKSFIYFSFLF